MKILFITTLFFLASSQQGSAVVVNYPYSVKIGDTIDYHIDTLRNGTTKGSLPVYGLNLTEGDNFKMEIYDGVSTPSTPYGEDFVVRLTKGAQSSELLSGLFLLYTSNETYWNTVKNASYDYLGIIFSFSHTNKSATYSAIQNADNYEKFEFNPKDGLLISFEFKTTDTSGNYTQLKYTKGSSSGLFSNIPGFELPTGLIALFFMATIAYQMKRKKQ